MPLLLAAFTLLAAGGDGLPPWATAALTPAIVVGLLLTGQLRWGKGVDKEASRVEAALVKAETRAEDSEKRERSLQQGYMDKVLPLQERQIVLMQQVQDYLRSSIGDGRR